MAQSEDSPNEARVPASLVLKKSVFLLCSVTFRNIGSRPEKENDFNWPPESLQNCLKIKNRIYKIARNYLFYAIQQTLCFVFDFRRMIWRKYRNWSFSSTSF